MAPIIVQRISFQSKCNFVDVAWINSHEISPVSEIKFAVKCLYSFNHLFVPFNCGIMITNKAGIPIAGKKFGATPNKYFIVKLSPIYFGLMLSITCWYVIKQSANNANQ